MQSIPHVGGIENGLIYPTFPAKPVFKIAKAEQLEGLTLNLPAITNLTNSVSVDSLVDGGKLYYEMGKIDEAEKRIRSALAIQADHEKAKYYLKLIEEKKARPYRSGETLKKLEVIRVSSLQFQNIPLPDVLKQIVEASIQGDPEKLGINILSSVTNDVRVTVTPELKDLKLPDALDAVVAGANQPIHYSLSDAGYIAFHDGTRPIQLFTRAFDVNGKALLEAADRIPRRLAITSKTNATATTNDLIRTYFETNGIELQPPESVFFNEPKEKLIVRATESDLEKVAALLAQLPGKNSGATNAPKDQLITRSYKVDPGTFSAGLKEINLAIATQNTNSVATVIPKGSGNETAALNEIVRKYLTAAGVEIKEPKTAFYNDRNGMLLVRATEKDMEIIDVAIQTLNTPPAQVVIEAKFVEMNAEDSKVTGFDWYLGNKEWLKHVTSGEYQQYYKKQYEKV